MSQQSARQQARRAALDAQARMRAERAEQDRRRERLAVDVVTALAERDTNVAACETRAGRALASLTRDEGLSIAEAVRWCGDNLTTREVSRLRRIADARGGEPPRRRTGAPSLRRTGDE